jgi:hypothetical protein
MEPEMLPDFAIHAYLRLMALNMAAWRPQVAEWLHSEDAEPQLKELLAVVPCSPTIH